MRIENSNGMPMNLSVQEKSKSDVENGVEQESNGEVQTDDSDTVHISIEGKQKLAEEEEKEHDHLPPHIQDMIKAIERLIKLIEAAEEALAAAKEATYTDEEAKRNALEGHQQQLNSLEFARADAIKVLQDAMKEAGISEPGIIMDLMR